MVVGGAIRPLAGGANKDVADVQVDPAVRQKDTKARSIKKNCALDS